MTDQPVILLRAGDKVLNPDGTVTETFRNAWNALVARTGTETSNDILGVINGAAQQNAILTAQLAAANAARIAGDQASASVGDGSGVTNATPWSGGLASSAAWTPIATVTLTPGGAGGDYTISLVPDSYINGALSDGLSGGTTPAVFNGAWRLVEELSGGGTEHVLASSIFTVTFTPQEVSVEFGGGIIIPETYLVEFSSLPGAPIAANEAAQVDIRLEIQRDTGANAIVAPGLSGSLSVTWTA